MPFKTLTCAHCGSVDSSHNIELDEQNNQICQMCLYKNHLDDAFGGSVYIACMSDGDIERFYEKCERKLYDRI